MLASVASLTTGDDPDAWRAAGFTVDDGVSVLGDTAIRFDGDGPGITAWEIFHPDQAPGRTDIDGLVTELIEEHEPPRPMVHPNGCVGFDHLVLSTSDIERTTVALGAIGVEPRRTRDTTAGDAPLRQRFFRMGTIIELIGPPEPDADGGPARFWGLALVTDDIDATAAHLGERISAPKDAVQPGRRIATVRTRDLGITVPVAFMTPHLR